MRILIVMRMARLAIDSGGWEGLIEAEARSGF